MDRHTDFILTKVLKKWAAHHRPPADGRELLLQKATRLQSPSPNKLVLSWLISQDDVRPDIFGLEWSHKLTEWLYYSFRPGYGNLSVV
jgi:hypothetical protein